MNSQLSSSSVRTSAGQCRYPASGATPAARTRPSTSSKIRSSRAPYASSLLSGCSIINGCRFKTACQSPKCDNSTRSRGTLQVSRTCPGASPAQLHELLAPYPRPEPDRSVTERGQPCSHLPEHPDVAVRVQRRFSQGRVGPEHSVGKERPERLRSLDRVQEDPVLRDVVAHAPRRDGPGGTASAGRALRIGIAGTGQSSPRAPT